MIPSFQVDGLLPPGDYEVSFEELRRSILTIGPQAAMGAGSWDAPWRRRLVENFELLTRQLWSVGVRDVYADGSFVEDKDHPNDIDGYFVCGLTELATGVLTQQLNLLESIQNLDVGPALTQTVPWLPEEATSLVASVSCGTLSACARTGSRQRHPR